MKIMVTGPDNLYPSGAEFERVFEGSDFSLEQVTTISTGSSATGVDNSVSHWARAQGIEVSGVGTPVPWQNSSAFRLTVASAVDGVIIVREADEEWEEEGAIIKAANKKGVPCSVVSLNR